MMRAGIHQITLPIPFPLQEVHVYLVEAGSGWIMIDAGFPSLEAREKLDMMTRYAKESGSGRALWHHAVMRSAWIEPCPGLR